ncbi:Mur ligase family protein [Natronincola ferrireducens]|uniref:Poly-gamma-glutamate synthase PgsB/CapB n=1 Tax=Natronincola ferrireducens TaxID=393762 RepID=A0A1G9FRI6_9FIRM|nr:Mur ligase family protein [Natronincola ferrireducens]SDK91014.1 poly-gamma-glutamate synthase PgsB/CapB [Natronincola ferrireducens]
MPILLILFILLIGGLYLEEHLCKKWRRNIKYVIHVNGIRGKSTVVRMIDAAFKNNGLIGIAKTTGSEAAIVMPNGDIKKIHRKTQANIREQRRILKMASDLKCDYLIVECMAVNPKLQLQSETILKADVAVITNVKEDHLGILGYTKEEIAQSLLMVKPKQGILITDTYYKPLDANHHIKKAYFQSEDTFSQNANMALSVCEYFGLDLEKSRMGLKNYTLDIGHQEIYKVGEGIFINGFSANDYGSTKILLNKYKDHKPYKKAILYNHRQDRPDRLTMMLDLILEYNSDIVYLSGNGSPYVHKKLKKLQFPGDIILIKSIKDIEFDGFLIVGIGNIKGFGIQMLEEEVLLC